MLFTSIDFFIFLPVTLLVYWTIPKSAVRVQNIWLLAASYVFYGWWDWRFLSLLAVSSAGDYLIGRRMASATDGIRRRFLMAASLTLNLGLLGYFKYFNFFAESFVDAFKVLGFPISLDQTVIILPVGISFYTFQTLSYSIDVYRRKIDPTTDWVAFFSFVSFFPQLVAGPIERASHLLPQFLGTRTYYYPVFSRGIKLIVYGFFMKLVIADRAAIYVNAVYGNVFEHGGLTFLLATVLFAFQIYGDFGGYSLIAIGTAKLFGFSLMTNFKRPYLASSVGEFWSRWHISLSTWFRDYVYIPLGGNRCTKTRWLINLFLTFLISGLWHGASWTFVIWGGLNGLYLIAEVLASRRGRSKGVMNIAITFLLINFSWIFFRAESISDAMYIVESIFLRPGKLFLGDGADVATLVYACMGILAMMLSEVKREFFNGWFHLSQNRFEVVRMLYFSTLLFVVLYVGVFGESQFIYFQF